MLIWPVTIFFILAAVLGWLFLKRDPERYIHRRSSPIDFFFRFGNFYHYLFKIAIIALAMILFFCLYRYALNATIVFSYAAAFVAAVVLAAGKEMLDYKITLDDIITSLIGIIVGFLAIYLFF